MYDLNEVFKNGPQDIQERMDVIANTIDGIMKLQSELQALGYWCPHCQRWYYQDDCGLREKHILNSFVLIPSKDIQILMSTKSAQSTTGMIFAPKVMKLVINRGFNYERNYLGL